MDSLRSTAKGVIVIGGALLAVALGAVIALAWAANGSAAGVSSAATVPRGQQPSGTVSGNTVSLTWGASTLPDGTPVDGYIVKRYPNGGATPVMTSSLVASASFTDSNVPPGTWQYSDTPMKAGWPGAESPVSAPLTVAPAITLSPGSGSPGTVLSVSGSSFNSSAPLTFTFSGSAVSTTPSAPATDAGGGFSGVTFTVPGDPAGTYTVKVADGGGAYATASFAITPSIQLSPVSGFVRSSASVSGNGFAAGSALTATYDGSALTLSGTTTTDTTGAFSGMTFTVPPSTAGDHTIAVTDHSGNSASASFTVNPAVKLSPTSGPAGTTVTVQGGGFSPAAAISTTFFGGAVATTPASPATDANGSFSLTFNVPNYSASSVDYAVAETDAQGFTASAGFMITGASLTFSPAAGVAGQALTISGASWPASSTVAVYIGPGSTNLLCSVSTDASGNIVTTGQSCPAPTNLVAGTYPISGALGSVDVIARAKFTLKPTIKLYTSSADTTVMTRGAPGDSVYITGHGFAASSALSFTLGTVVVTPSPGPTSDATGSFSNVQVVIPASTGAGAMQLAVGDSASPANSASGSITIYTATVSTSPTSGKAGTTFTVSGTGWPASESVTILFRDASTLTVTTVTCPTAAAASSTGALSGTCTVPALSAGITYDVFASDGQVRVRAGSGFTITS